MKTKKSLLLPQVLKSAILSSENSAAHAHMAQITGLDQFQKPGEWGSPSTPIALLLAALSDVFIIGHLSPIVTGVAGHC
jgi:hypothetical protein